MGTKKAYDMAVVVGSYTDSTGQQKNRYQNIGAVMVKDDGGKFILMERSFNPAGLPYDASKGNNVLVSLFEPRQHGQSAPAAGAGSPPPGGEDDIPF